MTQCSSGHSSKSRSWSSPTEDQKLRAVAQLPGDPAHNGFHRQGMAQVEGVFVILPEQIQRLQTREFHIFDTSLENVLPFIACFGAQYNGPQFFRKF